MTVEPWDPIRGQMHFLRTLGDQRRIHGARHLSVNVIFDFEEDSSDIRADDQGSVLMAPRTEIRATIFVPAPCESELSRSSAGG